MAASGASSLALLVLRQVYAAWLFLVYWSERLRCLLLDSLVLRRPSLDGLPEHVGIVIGIGEASETARVAQLVGWCADAGIRRLTLCDAHGELLMRTEKLRAELAARSVAAELETDAPAPSAAGTQAAPARAPAESIGIDGGSLRRARPLRLRVMSSRSGRAELVDAARALCTDARDRRLNPSEIDEAQIDSSLRRARETPEVGLVLQYCDEALLGGLLPWHTRIAHFIHMGRLSGAREAALYRALRECSGVTQRHGA
jgi:undecaprenyl pyrophosphate synthase